MDVEKIREVFSVMNNAYASYTFQFFLDSMEALGLTKVDLWGGVQHFDPYCADAGYIRSTLRKLTERGLSVTAYTPEILAYPYNIASEDDEVRRESIAYIERNIWIAAQLEAPVMLLSPGWGMWDRPKEEARKRSVDSLALLAQRAETLGVRLALEHLTIQSSNLLNCVGDVQKAVSEIGNPYFGAVLDLGQMSVFGENVSDYFQALGDKVFVVHMMDGGPQGHLAFGDGVLPLQQYYADLQACGYRGPITLEINDGRYARDPHHALQQCVAALRCWEG